jgi:hypothetical protein
MLLAIMAIAVGTVASLITGGRFVADRMVRVRGVRALLGGAVLEVAAGLGGPGAVGTALVVTGYALLVAFAVANLRITGMVLVAAGLLANATVMALDGGMPVRGAQSSVAADPRHHAVRPSDRLVGLADVISLGPIGETVSGGDIILCLGAATVTWSLTRPSRRRPPTRARSTS